MWCSFLKFIEMDKLKAVPFAKFMKQNMYLRNNNLFCILKIMFLVVISHSTTEQIQKKKQGHQKYYLEFILVCIILLKIDLYCGEKFDLVS